MIIFVVVPLLLVGPILWFVSWQSRNDPPPVLTSDVLAHGDDARAEIVSIKSLGGFLDTRPMVRVRLRVQAPDAPIELDIVQSIPRAMLRELREGTSVSVRITPDHATAALVL
ncbi:MAG: hypothetical protein ACYDH6_15105 [Acidimicrobiales bacterium]